MRAVCHYQLRLTARAHNWASTQGNMVVQATVKCEHPNASLYTFTGNLVLQPLHEGGPEVTCPLSQASVLLRGCTLRNTASILGIAIFTGHESKARAPSRLHEVTAPYLLACRCMAL